MRKLTSVLSQDIATYFFYFNTIKQNRKHMIFRVFDLIDACGMEQQEFAQLIGTNKHVVSKWRTGDLKSYRKYPPQIAEVLNTTTEYLLTGEGSITKATTSETEINSKAAVPEGSGLVDELGRIFPQLTPENQNVIIAEMLKRHRNQ